MLQNYFFKHLRLSDRNVRPTIKLKTIGRTDILVYPNSYATPAKAGIYKVLFLNGFLIKSGMTEVSFFNFSNKAGSLIALKIY